MTQNTQSNENESKNVQSSGPSYESCIETSFFYTNDKFLNNFDNKDILSAMIEKYPDLTLHGTDQHIKKSLIKFFNNDDYVCYILDYFNITLFDLFKFLYGQYPGIFKGAYLKKMKALMATKTYVTNQSH